MPGITADKQAVSSYYAAALLDVRVEQLRRKSKTAVPPPRTLQNNEWPPNYDDVLVWRAAQLARFETDPEFLAAAKAFYRKGWQGCVAFINHWCDTFDTREVSFGEGQATKTKNAWMPFILFAKQEEFVRFIVECLEDDSNGLCEKSRTMGASWLAIGVSVWLFLFHPGVSIGWGSQKAENVDEIGNPKSIFWKIRELLTRIPKVFKPEIFGDSDIKQMLCHNPDNGSTIVGEVGDSIGRGGRTRIFFKDESAHYEHPELIEAALSENTRVAIDISSVNGLGNLFHRKRESGIDWYPGKEIEPGYTRVFVLDSHDHPEYDEAWHARKKAYYERQGTPHIYEQEIARNYAASVVGVIIPHEWLEKCVDAHKKLGIPRGGMKISGLDIGDSADGDRNAQSTREGICLFYSDEWVAKDPGVTARKAMATCVAQGASQLQYDAGGGLGSNVKSQVNMLKDSGAMPKKLLVIPWNPGGKVLLPAERVVPSDPESPRNKDFYMNLKAQAWWHLREIVYNTYMAVTNNAVYDPEENEVRLPSGDTYSVDDLISLDSAMPLLKKIMKELCQATATTGARLKLVVDKAPDGTKSPNIADSIVMAYFPMPRQDLMFTDIGLGAKVAIGGVELR